ncbi:glycosyltransferase [Cyclobacterium jeungdonense]|uniref:Glycosyltransferase n=1 Tax=Cyclobacterium jeungdonense TaxID=708087 RepID=A0ABT8C1N7_9BACT|nr:glycosyltransferase [Cyclobacterium jeungdonense]MDN3686708.1 glycosyltransferase [Cyclobacterium jeungdonense]
MENAYSLWKKGLSGSHHVWGKVELDKMGKVDMTIFPHEKHPLINKIGKFFGIGHLDQQIRLLGSLKKFDILYSPYSKSNTKLLLLLKVLGLFKKPIVVTIHQPFWQGKNENPLYRSLSRFYILNYDACIFLSEPLMKKTISLLNISEKDAKKKFSLAQWGPDITYLDKFSRNPLPFESCEYFISAGHTDRDFETLIEAFRGLDYKLWIFCTPKSIPKTLDIPPNVTVNWEVTRSYDLIPFYQKSIAILIPLKYPEHKEGCQGMTSLQDVVSFSKPVIMTRNPCLNLDIEKEGIGKYVGMYDVQDWKNQLTIFASKKSCWVKMSENSRQLFETKFNSEIFAAHLEKVLLATYKKKSV